MYHPLKIVKFFGMGIGKKMCTVLIRKYNWSIFLIFFLMTTVEIYLLLTMVIVKEAQNCWSGAWFLCKGNSEWPFLFYFSSFHCRFWSQVTSQYGQCERHHHQTIQLKYYRVGKNELFSEQWRSVLLLPPACLLHRQIIIYFLPFDFFLH